MGNMQSHCQEAPPEVLNQPQFAVKDAFKGESTATPGADASNDATDTAGQVGAPPAVALDAGDAPAAVIGPKSALDLDDDDDDGSSAVNQESFGDGDDVDDDTEDVKEGVEEPDEEGKKEIALRTACVDPRFPSANQARRCYTSYNEYYRCQSVKGDSPECSHYARTYRSICPTEWIQRWNELREEGAWFGKY